MNRFEKRRSAHLKQMKAIGPFVEGTLVRIPHKNCRHVAHRLTFKVKAKTRAVYIPVDLVDETIQWTKNYRQLKKLIRAVTTQSLAILHHHVRAKVGAKPKRRRKFRR
jgi:hypothetical protein